MALNSARIGALQVKWQEARDKRPFPPLAAIDPIVLKPFLTDLVVVCMAEPAQPRFRLFGSGFRDFLGVDCSGMAVLESPFPEREAMAETYGRVAQSGQPEFGHYSWCAATGGTYHSEYVILPYGDDDRVQRLVVMEDLDAARLVRRRVMARLSA
jgi:hypothetical protein